MRIEGQTASPDSARALLQRLMRYPGETWEQRWLASGYDAAPRTWMNRSDLPRFDRWSPTLLAMNALLQIRVLRPSYSWLLDSHQKVNLSKFLDANGGDAIHQLLQLPAYQAAIPKQKVDAENALVRVMIRTGKQVEQLIGSAPAPRPHLPNQRRQRAPHPSHGRQGVNTLT